jgi:prepilin peptidase CpaA
MTPLATGTLLAFVVACVVIDVRTRRIPNLLSAPAMAAGIVLGTVSFGLPGLLGSMAGLLTAALILFLPFAFGGVGAGDVKMMAAVGSLVGPVAVLGSLGLGMALGGIVMCVSLARRGRLREKLATTGTMVMMALQTGSAEPLRVSPTDAGAVALPYSVPLGLGTLGVVAMMGGFGSWM